ncbi:DNA-binding SARP family transcriptional activator [Tamaricihabitans halophyticus]|uniref:DNA-binding SARP family transcriptional activator n=1 Tax=Tamaricihabitans halophyticus TaxID=1262583 RepID=A0A4R2Q1Y5_9PSEU|nr:tetratricopeptide repeat protein [Tamaricihabitans halophyticus]TCP41618.1 DNA-binding SARP family transcriptional activator [Tamaricihabitans halophyticus]
MGSADPDNWEFDVLGPLAIRRNGRQVELAARMLRAVLVSLLLRPGEVVTAERLISHLWGAEAPPTARATLRNYVRRLRTALDSGLVQTAPEGYLLRVPHEAVDLHRFQRSIALAGRTSDPRAVKAHLTNALGLRRGPLFTGLDDLPIARDVGPAFEEQYLLAVENHAAASLSLGEHERILPALAEFTPRYPLRERLVALWMSALQRAGRRSEALEVYRRTRRQLVNELGVEPGEQLRQVHQQVLAEQDLTQGQQPLGQHVEGVRALAQLPTDIAEFTGRREELDGLRRLVADQRDGTATAVAVITGMAGVGKTRLAVHGAHSFLRDGEFTDAQLWLDLRGFDSDHEPVTPAEALERCLRFLGVPAAEIPTDEESRGALFRDRLAGKSALLLLDNAANEAQIRPLIPATPGCLVLVTSRRSLVGLTGAHVVRLSEFDREQAIGLLGTIAGEQIGQDPTVADRIAELCGDLPLAVALTGRRLRANPTWTARDLVEQLDNADRRLDRLSAGARSLRAVFDLSYLALPEQHRRLFRLLSLYPGKDFTADAASALAGIGFAEAETYLEDLADEHLLQHLTPGRYSFHDLIKPYARSSTHAEDDAEQRQEALERLFAHYIERAGAARGLLAPRLRSPIGDGTAPVYFTAHHEALAWCEAERDNLVASTRASADMGVPAAWQLPALLLSFYYLRSHWEDWRVTHRSALAAARSLADPHGEAVILRGLGVLHSDLQEFDESIRCHEQAQEIFTERADQHGMAWNLNNLGVVLVDLNRLDEADDTFQQALPLFRNCEDVYGEGICLNNLGDTQRRLNNPSRAAEHLAVAQELQRRQEDHNGLRYTLASLGDIHQDEGQYSEATGYYREAMDLSTRFGDHRATARIQSRLADALTCTGRAEDAAEAEKHRQAAAAAFEQLGDPQAGVARHTSATDEG